MSYAHNFKAIAPPRVSTIRGRIAAETGRTCSSVKVDSTEAPPKLVVTLDAKATGADLEMLEAIVGPYGVVDDD